MSNLSIDWTTIIAVIVGAFLAVLGGSIERVANKKVLKKTAIQKKTEEVYLLLIQEKAWIIHRLRECVALRKIPDEIEIQNPIEQIVMIITLYHSKLTKYANKLSGSIEAYRKVSFNFWGIYVKTKKKPSVAEFDKFTEPFDCANKACDELIEVLVKEFSKHL